MCLRTLEYLQWKKKRKTGFQRRSLQTFGVVFRLAPGTALTNALAQFGSDS